MADKPTPAKRKSVNDDILVVNLVTYYFKLAGAVLVIWLVGYFAFSPSWLLLGLVLFVWKFKYMTKRQQLIETSQDSAKDEKSVVLARCEELPAWVIFPDVERAEWFNKILSQMWPFLADYIHDLVSTSVETSIRGSLPSALQASFKFSKIDMGDIPPRIGGVKVYTEYVRRDEIVMDVELIYSSDSEITIQVKGINAGIKDLTVNGMMRVIMKPLIPKMPIMGGLTVFFLNSPTIDFNLTSLANAFDIPGLSDMLHSIVDEQVSNLMVLPNRMAFSLTDNLHLAKLMYPLPQGVLRITVVEAKDLMKADVSLLGKGKSDPYVVLKVGSQEYKTEIINNSLAPQWNQVFQMIVDEQQGQVMSCTVKDHDPGTTDDALGSVHVDVDSVLEAKEMDTWLPLENVKSGMLHLNLQWLYLVPDPLELEKALKRNEAAEAEGDAEYTCLLMALKRNEAAEAEGDAEYTCLLMVRVDSARDLPTARKSMAEPNPYVKLSIGQMTEECAEKLSTTNPRWEENFRMFIHNPHVQELNIQVLDKKSDSNLGHAVIPLKNLLMATDLTLDQQFDLKESGVNSQIALRLCLRVMTADPKAELLNRPETLIDPNAKPAEETPEKTDENSNDAPKDAPKDTGNGDGPKVAVEESVTAMKAPLQESGLRQRNVTSNEGAYKLGRIQLTIRYSEQRQILIVAIHKCVCLLPLDSDDLSDPYIKMYLLPDRSSSTKRKTDVIKNNLNPVFDVTFEYELKPNDVRNRSLELEVKNKNSFFSSAQEFMGQLVLKLSDLDLTVATTQWYDLEPEGGARSTRQSDV